VLNRAPPRGILTATQSPREEEGMVLRESLVPTPFGRFHVEETGAGAPVLFVHGGTASTREWRPVLTALGAHARCIAVDRLGCGLSDRSARGYGGRALTDSLLGLADALGLDRFGVVGQSYGGFFALALAQAAPERISRLVLVNSAAGPWTAEEWAALGARLVRDPSAPAPEEQIEQTMRWIFADAARAPAGFRDDLRWQLERAAPGQIEAGRDDLVRMAAGPFDEIAGPTLVVWGEADPLFRPEMGRRLAAAIPGARYAALPGCGHTCQVECPDAFVAVVAPFLDQSA
jgi:3-oxoadipate enol-lactonase